MLLPSAAMLVTHFYFRRRMRLASDPNHVRRVKTQRALEQHLRTMERAAEHGRSTEFFAAACAVFQNLFGQRWNLSPKTITFAEINDRLNGEAHGLRLIFNLADEVIYTGRVFAPDELRGLQALVNNELRRLEAL